jgi:hypothetical protein
MASKLSAATRCGSRACPVSPRQPRLKKLENIDRERVRSSVQKCRDLACQPSTSHKGFEPRINVPVTPAECIAKLSVRFSNGSETAIVPFVEFGHRVARIKFTKDRVFLLADHDSLKVAETTELKYEPGRWYHLLAEWKGDEFVVQFLDGPTLYAKHPSYALPPPSGAPGLGIAGPKDGVAEIDNVTIWTIKPEAQENWESHREAFTDFVPVLVKDKPTKKKKIVSIPLEKKTPTGFSPPTSVKC